MWFSRKKSSQELSADEILWIEENYQWMTETFGLQAILSSPLVFVSDTHFPTLYADEKISIDGCIIDMKKHFQLVELPIEIVLSEKKDAPSLKKITSPNNKYLIKLNEIPGDVNELIYLLAIYFAKIKLLEEGVVIENEESIDLFLFLCLTYFGYGELITKKIYGTRNGIFLKEVLNEDMAAGILSIYLKVHHLKVEANWFIGLNEKIDKLLKNFPFTSLIQKLEAVDQINTKIKSAWKMYDSGMFVLAASVCQEILPLAPENTYLLDSLGYFLLRDQKYDDAITYFKQAISLEPDYANAHNNLGFAFLMNNELDKGNHHLKISFSLDNENAMIERNLGIYKSSIGELDEAFTHFERALKLDNDLELIHYFIGLAYLESGQHEKAITALKKSADKKEEEAIELLDNLKHD